MKTLRTTGLKRDERGQALVEFALILPIILLLVVGMLEFARAWNLHQVMTDAAREGARRAVIGGHEGSKRPDPGFGEGGDVEPPGPVRV